MTRNVEDRIWKAVKAIEAIADVVRPRKVNKEGFGIHVPMVLHRSTCSCSCTEEITPGCETYIFTEMGAEAECPECGCVYEPIMF